MTTTAFRHVWKGWMALVVSGLFFSTPMPVTAADSDGDVNQGARAWADHCGRCHNLRQAVEFRDDLWTPIINHMRVRAGIPGDMARDIRAFLQASNYAGPAGAPADSGLSGQDIYSNTCIACHGAGGKGVLPGVPNLADRLDRSPNEVLLQRVIEGYQTPGSTMAMPARGGNPNLSDKDIERVLTYMRRQFTD